MKLYLLDLKNDTWMQAHGRDVLILGALSLIALSLIVGLFIWIRRRRRSKAKAAK